MEKIVAAAIKGNGQGEGRSIGDKVYSLPPPGRHHNVIGMMVEAGEKKPIVGEQGFLTDTGRFVDRKEGARIAIEAGQIQKLNWPPDLFSEDLW